MKRVIPCLLAYLVAVMMACAGQSTAPTHSTPAKPEREWGAETNGLRLSLTFAKTNFQSGEEIVAILVTTNVGTVPVQVPDTSLGNFRFNILNRDGKQVPLTPGAEKSRHMLISTWNSERTIPPKGCLATTEQLNNTWEMSRAGIYSVTAIRPISRSNWMELKAQGIPLEQLLVRVVSNTVEVEVIDGKTEPTK